MRLAPLLLYLFDLANLIIPKIRCYFYVKAPIKCIFYQINQASARIILVGKLSYIIYDEVMEGMAGTIRNKIKITGDASVEIMKSGVSGTHMVFEKNKKNLTYYKTPYGQMLIGINTKNMKVSVSEDNIDVLVDYELDVNHEPLADCKIRMNITSKNSGDFSVLS